MSLPMSAYNQLLTRLVAAPHTWLITGVAGFIGSNLLETLLKLNQRVVGLDSFATGHQRNLDEVQTLVTPTQWANFNFILGDIRELADCQKACQSVDYVLHQAALGSVPRSLKDPITTNGTNITGFLNMLVAARDARVKSFTYAASSSTYGDHPGLPKVEDVIGQPLSPYAVTKYVNELYANLLAATVEPVIASEARQFMNPALNQVYNVAMGDRTTLNELFALLRVNLAANGVSADTQPVYRDFRAGDVRHSQADIGKAQRLLSYAPSHRLAAGIAQTIPWYVS